MRILGPLLACWTACSYTPPVAVTGGDPDPLDASTITDGSPADTPGDRDGDGVLDPDDVCPDDFDPDQRDHDGDGRGDVCDHCPHLADPTDPDQDGDGVGDACDPRPTQAGDQRVYWFGFYDSEATEVMSWAGSGTWTVAGGMLDDIGTETTGFQWTGPPGDIARPYIMSAVRFNTKQGTGSWTAAVAGGVVGVPNVNLSQFHECFTVAGSSANGGPRVAAQGTGGLDTEPRPDVPAGGITTIALRLDSNLDCTFTGDNLQASTMLTASNLAPGRVHMSSQRAQVSFDYLFVVSIGE